MQRAKTFSPRQVIALSWWRAKSSHCGRDAIICDGAVRSGKTMCLSLSFAMWAMARFSDADFGLCAKTLAGVRRNVVTPLTRQLRELDMVCSERRPDHLLEVRRGERCNRFWLFGGNDEGAAARIQGVTLAGVLLDEVALLPRSFVEQAVARCSVEGARLWFSCNPEHPRHWFYTEWIEKTEEKNALYLHFTMEDNPALSPAVRERYRRLYSGVFYQRYVLGEWVSAHGAVYPMFDSHAHVVEHVPPCSRFVVSCDYGTVNPTSFGLWGKHGGIWYRLAEVYHNSRRDGQLLTDEEYADMLEALAAERRIEAVVVDPAAASFIQCLRRRGKYAVVPADNRVLDGIRLVAGALKGDKLRFHRSCADTLREFALYRWDLRAQVDKPVKENDHAMDDIRYFCMYAFGCDDTGFFAASVKRS